MTKRQIRDAERMKRFIETKRLKQMRDHELRNTLTNDSNSAIRARTKSNKTAEKAK